jgi:hypothetical protein
MHRTDEQTFYFQLEPDSASTVTYGYRTPDKSAMTRDENCSHERAPLSMREAITRSCLSTLLEAAEVSAWSGNQTVGQKRLRNVWKRGGKGRRLGKRVERRVRNRVWSHKCLHHSSLQRLVTQMLASFFPPNSARLEAADDLREGHRYDCHVLFISLHSLNRPLCPFTFLQRAKLQYETRSYLRKPNISAASSPSYISNGPSSPKRVQLRGCLLQAPSKCQ